MNFIRFLPRILVFLTLFLFAASTGKAQEENDKLPDGTQGEELENLKGDSLPKKWKDKRWRLFPGKYTSFKMGGGFLYEFAGYSQDVAGKKQMDSLGTPLEPAFKTRDLRITLSGKLRTKRTITWKAGFMYEGAQDAWLVRETGVMVDVPEISSKFFLGRTKEGFSLNKVMVGYAGWTPERQMAIDMIPILADGIKWLGFLPKQKIFWNLGVFGDWLSHGQGFSTFSRQAVVRAGWLPIYSKEKNRVLHTGFSFRYGKPVNGQIQLRSKPEANPAPYFITTGKFNSDASISYGYEIYFNNGPLLIGSEVYVHQFKSTTAAEPFFIGGEVGVCYLFTGESRPYHPETSIFGFVPVKKSVFKGGAGAWEGVLRVSSMNLDGGDINGGSFWRITPMVNWYLSKDVRLELAYGYGVLQRFNLSGGTHFFQCRLQLTLM